MTTTYNISPHLSQRSVTAILTLHHLSSSADQGGSPYNRIVRRREAGAESLRQRVSYFLKSFLLSPKTGPDKWPSDAPCVCVCDVQWWWWCIDCTIFMRAPQMEHPAQRTQSNRKPKHMILEYTSAHTPFFDFISGLTYTDFETPKNIFKIFLAPILYLAKPLML